MRGGRVPYLPAPASVPDFIICFHVLICFFWFVFLLELVFPDLVGLAMRRENINSRQRRKTNALLTFPLPYILTVCCQMTRF